MQKADTSERGTHGLHFKPSKVQEWCLASVSGAQLLSMAELIGST